MERLADFWVNWVEPGFKFLVFFVILMAVIWFVNLLRDPKNALDLARRTTHLVWNYVIVGSLVFVWKFFWGTLDYIARTGRLIFAILRDFFTSHI